MKIELNNKVQIAPSGKSFKLITTVFDNGTYWNIFKYIDDNTLFGFNENQSVKISHDEAFVMATPLQRNINLK